MQKSWKKLQRAVPVRVQLVVAIVAGLITGFLLELGTVVLEVNKRIEAAETAAGDEAREAAAVRQNVIIDSLEVRIANAGDRVDDMVIAERCEADITAARTEARSSGYADGERAGREAGYQDGFQRGVAERGFLDQAFSLFEQRVTLSVEFLDEPSTALGYARSVVAISRAAQEGLVEASRDIMDGPLVEELAEAVESEDLDRVGALLGQIYETLEARRLQLERLERFLQENVS